MKHIILLFLHFSPIFTQSKGLWSYEVPVRWSRGHPYCGGNSQSPINIQHNISEYDRDLRRLIFENHGSSEHLHIVNNGHTAQLALKGCYTLRNVALQSEDYNVEQLHFHWSHEKDNHSSEHLMEGRSYPLEMHIVTYSSKYGSIREAMSNIRGLAVVGFFFQISETPNPALEPIIEALSHIHKAHDHTTLEKKFDLKELVGEERMREYYRYDGSLTTPPCFETVVWSVTIDPINISIEQLNAFRLLQGENMKPIKRNYRPVGPLGTRKLYRSFLEKGQIVETGTKSANEKNDATRLLVHATVLPFIVYLIQTFL